MRFTTWGVHVRRSLCSVCALCVCVGCWNNKANLFHCYCRVVRHRSRFFFAAAAVVHRRLPARCHCRRRHCHRPQGHTFDGITLST